jgi:thiol-disulfide isomerase/thioredoxin
MRIVKYGSSWCGPCRLATETLKKSGLPFEDIDIDNNPDVATELKISRIPHIQFFDDNNNLVHTHIGGLNSSDLNNIIENYGK